ncbi:hypothetical protein BDY19DRAFT_992544, partial [Irpex rosettiformis]
TSPKIITEANLYDQEVLQQIVEVLEIVETKLSEFESAVSETTELFLELDDEYECSYYLVDHNLQVQFWLEEVQTDELGARNCASDDHLRLELERFYWMHVEYFCSHESTGLNLSPDSLIDIMTQGRADQVTSTTSTFPYSIEDCGQFIECLQTLKGSIQCPSAFSKWTIARIWQNVLDVRFLTHYGQEHARVSSNISVLDIDVPEETLLFKCCDFLGFHAPQTYLGLLNQQWVDEIAHSVRWKPFITACQSEWKMSLLLSFAVLICNLLLISSPIASSTPIAIAAILLCNASVGAAVMLLIQHGPVDGSELASDLSDYLQAANSKHFGFQITAVAFSLPRALTLWALIVSSTQVVVVTLGLTLAGVCIGAVISVFLGLSALRKIGQTISSTNLWGRFCRCYGKRFFYRHLEQSIV